MTIPQGCALADFLHDDRVHVVADHHPSDVGELGLRPAGDDPDAHHVVDLGVLERRAEVAALHAQPYCLERGEIRAPHRSRAMGWAEA